MNKIYNILILDSADKSDIPLKIAEFNNILEAESFVRNEMRNYCFNYTWEDEVTHEIHGPAVYDEVKMYIESYDNTHNCQWFIIEANS